MKPTLLDNGGRGLGVDRRQFSYTLHIPKRRSGKEKRHSKRAESVMEDATPNRRFHHVYICHKGCWSYL